mgnify:CR=1 FL=1
MRKEQEARDELPSGRAVLEKRRTKLGEPHLYRLDSIGFKTKLSFMLKINIHEAKTHLSRYAQRVKAGEHFLICDRNVPFAELRPLTAVNGLRSERPLGMDAGKAHLSEDWDTPETNRQIAGLFGME